MNARTVSFSIFQTAENIPTSRGRKHCDIHWLQRPAARPLEHLHSGGLATTRRQAQRIALTEDSRVLDVGCGIGGPARYLAHTYGCRVDGIDLTPELIETGRV